MNVQFNNVHFDDHYPRQSTNSRVLFVTGNSRSGTTLMSRILGNSPRVFAFPELHFFDEIAGLSNVRESISSCRASSVYAALCSIQRRGYLAGGRTRDHISEARDQVRRTQSDTLLKVYCAFLQHEAARQGFDIPCDHTPQNLFYIQEILQSFPNARIVVMIRDPRAVLLSQKNKWRFAVRDKFPAFEIARAKSNYHPILIAKLWNASVKAARRWEHDERVEICNYEQLIESPAAVISGVCQFAGIEYSESMLDVPIINSSNREDDTNRGVTRDRAHVWKQGGLDRAEIRLCQGITGKYMHQMGYSPVPIAAQSTKEWWYRSTAPIKLCVALLFNLRRAQNIVKVIRKFV